jgi:trimeric autotransporter adhesin
MNNRNKNIRSEFYQLSTLLLFLCFAFTSNMYAQLSGTYYIDNTHITGGQYFANFTDAVTALNNGITGPVTFNVIHDQTFNETPPPVTASGTLSNPVIFQKSGSGKNPLIISGNGKGISDGIIVISGGSYITFDGIDLQDNPANSNQTSQMEWGYALLKANSSSPFMGCQHVVIKNCNISLNKSNIYSVGIYSGTHTYSAPNTPLAITAASDAMNNCNFYNNNISNVFTGIKLRGDSLAALPYNLYDQNNRIGLSETGAPGANHISNFGYVQPNTSWLICGIYVSYQNNIKINNNIISNDSLTGGDVLQFGHLYGIYTYNAAYASGEISGNSVTLVNASPNAVTSSMAGILNLMGGPASTSTLTISNNTIQNCNYSSAATTGTFAAIQNSASVGNLNIIGNTINNNSFSGTGNCYEILAGSLLAVPVNININNNTITNNKKLASGNLYCVNINSVTGIVQFYSNLIAFNAMHPVTSSSSTMYGFICGSIAAAEDDYNNQIHDLTISTDIANGSGTIYGMNFSGGNNARNRNIYGNQIYSLIVNNNNAGTYGGSSVIYGINMGAVTNTLYMYKNNIYNLTAYGTSPILIGISANSGYNLYLYNNFISDLNAPIANGISLFNILGMSLSNTNSLSFTGAYFNTVYLNSVSSGADFGTTAVYANSNAGKIELKNNLIINTSTPNGSGITYAFRRNAVSTASYSVNSDANDFYAGTPGPNNLIYYDGTNSVESINDLKNYLSSDSHSFSELPPFVNISSKPYDLHIKNGIATQLEGGGIPVSSPLIITDDYFGNVRNSSIPDVGANEFAGILKDQTPPEISFIPLGNTSSTSDRTIIATITDASGVPGSGIGLPRLYWKSSGSVYNSVIAVSLGNNQYQFTFGAGASVGQTVSYFIAAQDIAVSPNVGSSPSIGAGSFTLNPPSAGIPPFPPYTYSVLNGMSGIYHIGPNEVSPNFTKLTSAVTALNNSVISGPVTFILDSNYTSVGENFPLTFQKNDGSSPVNTLTLKPAAPGVVVNGFTNSPASNTILFLINGMSYFTIDGSSNGTTSHDLTLNNNCPNGGSFVVYLASLGIGKGATHITIKNCNVNGFVKSSDQAIKVASQNPANTDIGDNNDYCTIQNNIIKRCFVGISVGAAPWGMNTGLSIINNKIGDSVYSVLSRGIFVRGCISPVISGNEISNMIDSSSVGNALSGVAAIEIFEPVTDGIINNNIIKNIKSLFGGSQPVVGILIGNNSASNVTGLKIYNNFISGLSNGNYGNTTTLQNSPVGIRINNASGIKIYFNTVNINGAQIPGGTNPIPSAAFALDAGNGSTLSFNIDVRNNIFINTLSGGIAGTKNYAVWVKSPASVSNFDYNNYYAPAGTGLYGVLGYWWGNDYTSISGPNGIQNASSGDLHSVIDSVSFISSDDLHLAGSSLGDLKLSGIPINGITTDIDGDIRYSTPYMGGDEIPEKPLPVEIVTFAASVNGKDIVLSWKTASEKNTNYFCIERTEIINNIKQEFWTVSGEIKAFGNSTTPKQYSFTDKNLLAGKYSYRLKTVDFDGSLSYSKSVESEISVPKEYNLSQNYPNPFNPSTKIDYQIPFDSKVSIEVFNITGQKIGELINKEQSAGFYTIEVGAGLIHKSLASGVYIYRMTAVNKLNGNNFINIKKMIMLK